MSQSNHDSIEEEFSLLHFISRYSGGSVYAKVKTDKPENGLYITSPKGGIDERLFKDNFLTHFEEEEAKHLGLKKTDFIIGKIDFINGVSVRLKKDYNYILNDLKGSFERERSTLIEPQPLKKKANKGSYSVHAMALSLTGITLSKKGVGVNDEIDYAKKFDLKSGVALYNRLNGIENISGMNREKFERLAKEVIKKYEL